MKLKSNMRKRGTIAISQIVLLIISIFAITFLIALSTPSVSADGGNGCSSRPDGAGVCKPSCFLATETIDYFYSNGDNAGCSQGQYCCVTSTSSEDNSDKSNILKDIAVAGIPRVTEKISKLTTAKNPTTIAQTGGDTAKVSAEVSGKTLAKSTLEVYTSASATFWQGIGASFTGKLPEGTMALGSWGTVGAITGIFLAATAAVLLVHYGTDALGANERNVRGMTNTAIIAGSVSAVVGAIIATGSLTVVGIPIAVAVALITVISAGVWALFSYQDYSQEIFSYIPSLWQPVFGGEKCEQCNELDSGCNEYQCHTFGAGCELINQGTEYPACVWVNEGDMTPPEIQPLERVLQPDYAYTPLQVNLPSDRGARIVYAGSNSDEKQCVPAFTPLTLGVNTSQPAQCRIDLERKQDFSSMLSLMSEGNIDHTFFLPSSSLPSESAIESLNLSLANGNEYSFFIRCININGVESTMEFAMEFCVQDGPDTMAPEILYSNFVDAQACINADITTSPLEVYTNEPADCRWDFNNVDYEDMFYSMTCSQTIADKYPAGSMTYGCSGALEGIKETVQNKYYIKCKDQPWLEGKEDALGQRNANRDAYIILLQGSEPLIIDGLTINGEGNNAYIKDSTDTIKVDVAVNTLAGCSEGLARCAHGEVRGNQILYTDFYNEGSFDYLSTNTETFYLQEGTYSIPVRCTDEGGNVADTQLNFTIETDLTAPTVTRAYYEDNYLKLITSEEAECVYSADSCTYEFEDGSEISTQNGIDHFITWDTTKDLFVKCKDGFSNRPARNVCNIIVRAYDKRNA